MTTETGPDGLVELEVGKPAAGGGCVAHLADGRVAFVRHCLPGETVLAKITEESRNYVRADAITIGVTAPGRVRPPCPHSGPGKCGGCDYQHASLAVQRQLKALLVAEQLARLAGLDLKIEVEGVAGDDEGLAWRSRVRYSVLPKGRVGFKKYRSHEVQPIESCPLAATGIAAMKLESVGWTGMEEIEALALGGEAVVTARSRRKVHAEIPSYDGGLILDGRVRREPSQLLTKVGAHKFRVSAGSFWQVHVGAPEAITKAVRQLLGDCEGANVADLYAGVGLLTILLAEAVGPRGHVIAVERDPSAVRDAHRNLAAYQHVDIVEANVTADGAARELRTTDLAVLDPPRQGAGRDVMEALASSPRLRKVIYVACDAASFARDLRVMLDAGWVLEGLRALDLFPMTEHVELVASITRPDER